MTTHSTRARVTLAHDTRLERDARELHVFPNVRFVCATRRALEEGIVTARSNRREDVAN